MSQFFITVRIADRDYRLSIDRAQEELARKAAVKINEMLMKYAEAYAFKDKQDLLAMVALQNTILAIDLEQQISFQQNQLLQKLSEINHHLTESLSK